MTRAERLRQLAKAALYEQVDTVPEGLTWKPGRGPQSGRTQGANTTLFSLGNLYKLVRVRDTGAVTYFRLRDQGPEKSTAESIDAEPAPLKQQRFHVGALCWFISEGRWFQVQVVSRTQGSTARIVIRSHTGWDAERQTPWPLAGDLEFPAKPSNPIFQRLRKLSARQV